VRKKKPFFLAGFQLSSITEALLQNFYRQNVGLRLETTSTGDKRDNMSAYALRISDCPVSHLASVPMARGWPGLPGDVAFLKLSKLLNQEDALSAPCWRCESRAPEARPRGPHPC
jgi:hypothetical protein